MKGTYMVLGDAQFYGNKVIINIKSRVCENFDELLTSKLFFIILKKCVEDLKARDSELLGIFKTKKIDDAQ
ncbi:MAG TPA: hypothetical protein PKV41_00555, partial [Candidatus Omnitrophota bacterium]|nr:hypothetical protein [Candidatus Omnitrophota bacterium]